MEVFDENSYHNQSVVQRCRTTCSLSVFNSSHSLILAVTSVYSFITNVYFFLGRNTCNVNYYLY